MHSVKGMATRKLGTGRRERETDLLGFEQDLDDTLIDDEPEDGFALIDDQDEKPNDRRRDPLRKPI